MKYRKLIGIILLILICNLQIPRVLGQVATKAIKYQYEHQVNDQRILIETPVYGISKFTIEGLKAEDFKNVDPKSLENSQIFRIQAKDVQLKPLDTCQTCTIKMKLDRPISQIYYIDDSGQLTRILDYVEQNNILALPFEHLGTYALVYQSDEEIANSMLRSSHYIDAKNFSVFIKGIAIGGILLILYYLYRKAPSISLRDQILNK